MSAVTQLVETWLREATELGDNHEASVIRRLRSQLAEALSEDMLRDQALLAAAETSISNLVRQQPVRNGYQGFESAAIMLLYDMYVVGLAHGIEPEYWDLLPAEVLVGLRAARDGWVYARALAEKAEEAHR